MWTHRLELLFSPDRDICIDEQLVPYRGRCNFKQYIPSKPAKYGLKIWAVCDVKTSYAWRLQVYTGKAGDRAEVNQGMRVALELTEGLQGNTELPPQLLQTRGRAIFSSVFAFTLTHTIVSYVPRRGKNVLLMSTKHRTPGVSEGQKRKPVIIQDYNRCKGGVDNLDKPGVGVKGNPDGYLDYKAHPYRTPADANSSRATRQTEKMDSDFCKVHNNNNNNIVILIQEEALNFNKF
ncbi:piggyBac transposable element-derived protein 4-like [Oreochromis niloticus]|uniref:piggyBac transposable element-derived protein 4-like n=1 Tax=Oreochromis niloticus TaxID=8128 RepID=UPI000DF2B046|nr:piggyBac transposable element-derived protein 4-like [Oreochromis niloticus]